EHQPNVVESVPIWLFDIDTLTQSMNYQPVVVGNQPNFSAGIQENLTADPQNTDAFAFEVKEPESAVHVSPSSSDQTKKHNDNTKREAKGKSHVELSTGVRDLRDEFEEFFDNSTNGVNATTTPVTAIGPNSTNNTNTFSADDMPALEDITYSDDEEDVGVEADFSNLETNIAVGPIPTTRVHKDHPVTKSLRIHQALKDPSWINAMQGELLQFKMQKGDTQKESIDYEEVFASVARIEAIRTIEEEVYVSQPPGFKTLIILIRGKIDQTLFIKKQKDSPYNLVAYSDSDYAGASLDRKSTIGSCQFLGLQVKQKVDGIFINQDKYVAEILRKFGLTDGKSSSTPIDTKKPLPKDPDGEDVDVHTYRSMIGSLMYLTLSRPDIMFAVYACAHFQVTPKALHSHAVKRIF
nr:hypothetical protein [Tanacetum cinerariifolium]